ncbi:unnamed protein product [Cladocopium goreaui]|uniref:J domain-containing protein n=1 Tax=Cladocopium goreaui TaxID=2562237 RepID=A0A9P1FP79_9DINO|nr:unnamed protein product [Cladocopium goreaui]
MSDSISAFRKSALKFHPDKNKDKDAGEKFKQVVCYAFVDDDAVDAKSSSCTFATKFNEGAKIFQEPENGKRRSRRSLRWTTIKSSALRKQRARLTSSVRSEHWR